MRPIRQRTREPWSTDTCDHCLLLERFRVLMVVAGTMSTRYERVAKSPLGQRSVTEARGSISDRDHPPLIRCCSTEQNAAWRAACFT
jgi:hypothetical protein